MFLTSVAKTHSCTDLVWRETKDFHNPIKCIEIENRTIFQILYFAIFLKFQNWRLLVWCRWIIFFPKVIMASSRLPCYVFCIYRTSPQASWSWSRAGTSLLYLSVDDHDWKQVPVARLWIPHPLPEGRGGQVQYLHHDHHQKYQQNQYQHHPSTWRERWTGSSSISSSPISSSSSRLWA